MEHGVALRDLPDPVEDGSDLPGAQYARVSLHQWSVVVLVRQEVTSQVICSYTGD